MTNTWFPKSTFRQSIKVNDRKLGKAKGKIKLTYRQEILRGERLGIVKYSLWPLNISQVGKANGEKCQGYLSLIIKSYYRNSFLNLKFCLSSCCIYIAQNYKIFYVYLQKKKKKKHFVECDIIIYVLKFLAVISLKKL